MFFYTIYNKEFGKHREEGKELEIQEKIKNDLKKIPASILKSYEVNFYRETYILTQIHLEITDVFRIHEYTDKMEIPVIPVFSGNEVAIHFDNFTEMFGKGRIKREQDKQTEKQKVEEEDRLCRDNDQERFFDEEENETPEYDESLKREIISISGNPVSLPVHNLHYVTSDRDMLRALLYSNFTYYLILEGKNVKEVVIRKNPDQDKISVPFFRVDEKKFIIVIPLMFFIMTDSKEYNMITIITE